MRVNLICGAVDASSASRVVALHAHHLRLRGHDVAVYAVPPAPQSPSRAARLVSIFRGGARRRAAAPPGRPAAYSGLVAGLRWIDHHRAIVSDDVRDSDVVVATSWLTAEWVNALPARKGVKVYFIQHSDAGELGEPAYRVRATWRMPFRKIVSTQALADRAREYGDPSAQVVPTGVDLERFDAPPRQTQERLTLGFVYHHSQKLLLDTLDSLVLARARREVRVVAFGDRAPQPQLPLPAGARFELRPSLEALPGLYSSCDAWIVSGRSEVTGQIVLEAMACRTPVIAPRVGAAERLVEGCGWVVDEPWYTGIADAVGELAALDDAAWRARSDEAYERARENPWGEATDAMEAALEGALAEGPR